jgi:hypothetical protein
MESPHNRRMSCRGLQVRRFAGSQVRRFALIVSMVLIASLASGPGAFAHERGHPSSKIPGPRSCFYPAAVSNSITYLIGSSTLGKVYVDLGHDSCSSSIYQSYASFDASSGNVTSCSSSASLEVRTSYNGNLANNGDQSNSVTNFGPSATYPNCGTSFFSESYTGSPVPGTKVQVCVIANAGGGSKTTCTPTYTIP